MKAIHSDMAPAAIGPYSQAIRTGNVVFISGQLPIDPATGNFAEGGIKELTRQSLNNAKAILAAEGLTMADVVKTTVLMADMADFAEMNEVYAEFFHAPFPARSAFAVKTLPKNARVEIELIAEAK
ncbi:MAG: RidA family protein [Prevotella sp.]